MTNHWVDIKNADVVLIMGSNCAENHPIAFKWIMEAKKNGAKIISVDPRFTRTSSKADIYAPIRSGTDIAFLGGMIRYAIENGKYNTQYVQDCTNALFKVRSDYKGSRDGANLGNFSASSTWDYDYDSDYTAVTPNIKRPFKAAALTDSDCVFQKLRNQYSVYTPDMVERICGTPRERFLEICEAYIGSTDPDAGTWQNDRAGTMLYAMGWTQHTVGTQNIRAATLLQSLLGNMGVAGGGINALRGWHNVQGATDHAILFHYIPGYNSAPKQLAAHETLGTGPTDTSDTYLKKTIPLAMDPDAPTAPQSSNWWGAFAGQYNRARYVVSNLRAWWPTINHNTSWSYLPKYTGDCSYMSLMNAIHGGTIKGLFCWGTNPMVMGPDQVFERHAMDSLEWLVVCDLFHTETSDFFNRPSAGSSNTDVYLLPGAAYYEKKGSVTNSSRLAQWKDKACNPPGDAKDELDILHDLGDQIKSDYSGSSAAKDDPIKNLNWPYDSGVLGSDLTDGVAKEINGYALQNFTTPAIAGTTYTYTAGQEIDNFFQLMSGGETACGNWLFCGTWGKTAGNRMGGGATPSTLGRDPVDYHPQGIGIYYKWGYSWPVNRRIIYNRASVYQSTGLPLNPNKQVVYWNGTNWNGGCTGSQANDVVDGFGTSGPQTWLPYIMREEGVARLFGKGLSDGPFPEHWEPMETPLTQNILTVTGPVESPYISNWYSATFAAQGSTLYPIVCTTYRLSEHWHGGGLTRNLPFLNELMPQPFIEISEELAAIISGGPVNNGDLVTVSSARGSIQVKACVTKRFKPFVIDGATIHQVGLPWHWGYSGLSTGDSANILTPLIGDANTRIPEYKAFLVDITKP